MYIIPILLSIVGQFLMLEFQGRMIFVFVIYPRKHKHGKTANRAKKHYKANWTFMQRLFWIPVFKEEYEPRYKWMGIFFYIHLFFTIITLIVILITHIITYDPLVWLPIYVIGHIVFLVRFIYNNQQTGRGKIW